MKAFDIFIKEEKTRISIMHGRTIEARTKENSEDDVKKKARSEKYKKYRELSIAAVKNRYLSFPNESSIASSISSTAVEASANDQSTSTASSVSTSSAEVSKNNDLIIKKKKEEVWGLNALILKQNPDFYTLWNHRKEMILTRVGFSQDFVIQLSHIKSKFVSTTNQDQSNTRDTEETKSNDLPTNIDLLRIHHSPIYKSLTDEYKNDLLTNELHLTADNISNRNPKSYGAWYHRRWCIEFFGGNSFCNLQHELELCSQLLQADERNFHCWAYRNFIVSLITERELNDEIEFTTSLIERNFSNFSAWHHRSVILTRTFKTLNHDEKVKYAKKFLPKEFNMVQDAIFTEPDDQTPWMYQIWLLDQLKQLVKEEVVPNDDAAAFLESEISCCNDLIADNSERKWVLLALSRLLRLQSEILNESLPVEKLKEISQMLMKIDSLHKGFYEENPLLEGI